MSSFHVTSAEFAQQPLVRSPDVPPGIEPVTLAGFDAQSDLALIGESIAVRRLRSQIRRVAPYIRTALIRGERGTGKEVVARAIHTLSSVANGPFVVADACALSSSLALCLPYPRHSPSNRSTADVFRSARGGTVYITRIGELSLSHQALLFRFLQTFDKDRNEALHPGRGATDQRGAQVPDRSNSALPRILASSSLDLRTLAAIGQFRKDLYTRLSALEIYVPPLRGRIDDIPTFVERLLRQFADERGLSAATLSESVMLRLQQHPWPNNLRELRSVITKAAALAEGGAIETCHLLELLEPQSIQAAGRKSQRLHDVIQRHVLEVLLECEGNKVRAAELLGISRSTLYRMLGVNSVSGRLME